MKSIILSLVVILLVLEVWTRVRARFESYSSLQNFRTFGVPYSQLRKARISDEFAWGYFPPFVPLCDFDD